MVTTAARDRAPSLLLIVGARAVDPMTGLDDVVDVVVEAGRITRLGPGVATTEHVSTPGAVRIDAAGCWLLPALVDLHVHLREPGQEHKEDIASGLAAAAAGGYAHVVAMPNTRPVNDDPAVTRAMLARAAEVRGPTLHPVAAATVGLRGAELSPLAALREAGAVALSDDGRCVTSTPVMYRALRAARDLDMPFLQHAEEHGLTAGAQLHEGAVSRRLGLTAWPRCAEEAIVARDVVLAEATGARYHVQHLSTAGAVRLVRDAKERGLPVTAEVTPHHLMLTHDAVDGVDATYKVNPPLREHADVEALRAALADGTIDAIATDHAPHAPAEKEGPFAEAPPGMIGLELTVPVLLALVHGGELPLHRFVTALTAAPARIVGIAPPTLREGVTAELCLIDPQREHRLDADRLCSKSRNSPFVGQLATGSVELTMARGAVVHRRTSASATPK